MTDEERLKIDRMLDVACGNIHHKKVMLGARPVCAYVFKDGKSRAFFSLWLRSSQMAPWYVRFIKWAAGSW